MRDIHCPKDIGFENTFSGSECVDEQNYNDCFHCWNTALARNIRPQGRWEFDEKGYFSCSECKRKPKDQTATTDFCPNCGAHMKGGE